DNAAAALAAVEGFFDAPPAPEVLEQAFGQVVMPGRFEIVHRHPLVILDGAHNTAGAEVAAAVLDDEFHAVEGRILVVGMLHGRDPDDMLDALRVGDARLVVACTPPSPRAMPAKEVAAAAERAGVAARIVPDVARAAAVAVD